MNEDKVLPKVLFVWDQFGPYHMDRCEAVGAALTGRAQVVGVEIAQASSAYAWGVTGDGGHFIKRTLFTGLCAEAVSKAAVARALIREVSRPGVAAVFVAGYERPSHFAAASVARALKRRVVLMIDSRYGDKPRRAVLEAVKRVSVAPYTGGMAAGESSADYLRHLGLTRRTITHGYDTVSVARVRTAAPGTPPPTWEQRPFLVVARFIWEKNLAALVEAYAAYRRLEPKSPRRLVLCGAGPLENEIRAAVAAAGLESWVDFTGFLDESGVAKLMSRSLALVLPSVSETWGLVVNEALAFALPVLVSSRIGAIDLLAEDGGNGFVLDPHDTQGWAKAMQRLGADHMLWQRMSARSAALAPLGDVGEFVRGTLPHLDLQA